MILKKAADEINNIKINYALRGELAKRGAKNIDAALRLFDFEGITMENGEIFGMDEKMESFVYENDFLFENKSTAPVFSAPTGNKGQKAISREEFAKMGYSKRLELYNLNPKMYEDLVKK